MSVLPPWLAPEVAARRRQGEWPHWCSPPLVEAQWDLVRDYAELIKPVPIGGSRGWSTVHRNLAKVKCKRCGAFVGTLALWAATEVCDDEAGAAAGMTREWAGGALYRGTRRTASARLDIARSYAHAQKGSVPRVPMDDQYLALIEVFHQSLPHQLPAWCDCGSAESVGLAELRRAAERGRAHSDAKGITIRV